MVRAVADGRAVCRPVSGSVTAFSLLAVCSLFAVGYKPVHCM
jgi:hypothetical protein